MVALQCSRSTPTSTIVLLPALLFLQHRRCLAISPVPSATSPALAEHLRTRRSSRGTSSSSCRFCSPASLLSFPLMERVWRRHAAKAYSSQQPRPPGLLLSTAPRGVTFGMQMFCLLVHLAWVVVLSFLPCLVFLVQVLTSRSPVCLKLHK